VLKSFPAKGLAGPIAENRQGLDTRSYRFTMRPERPKVGNYETKVSFHVLIQLRTIDYLEMGMEIAWPLSEAKDAGYGRSRGELRGCNSGPGTAFPEAALAGVHSGMSLWRQGLGTSLRNLHRKGHSGVHSDSGRGRLKEGGLGPVVVPQCSLIRFHISKRGVCYEHLQKGRPGPCPSSLSLVPLAHDCLESPSTAP
jgi:hypothetical protein